MKKSIFSMVFIALGLIGSSALAGAATLNVERGKQVSDAQVRQDDGQLVVFGTVSKGVATHRVIGAHVHVQLLDNQGRTITTETRSLAPATPKRDAASNYRSKYTVEFSQPESTKASTVRVQYISSPHQECQSGTTSAHCESC